MDRLQKKTFTTQRGLTYSYYVSPKSPASESLPGLLMMHGFPDDALMWKDVVSRLSDLPNRFIIPDLIGFGESSKPSKIADYAWGKVQNDIVQILQEEDIKKVVAIGHDWGSMVSQRLYHLSPEVVAGLALVAVGYIPPLRHRFDVTKMNDMMEKAGAPPLFAYVEFFNEPGAAELIMANPERFWEVMHGAGEDITKRLWCTRGAMKKHLEGNEPIPLRPYGQDLKKKKQFLERTNKIGIHAPMQWHRAILAESTLEDELKIPDDRATITVPVLYLGASQDIVNSPEKMDKFQEEGVIKDLEATTFEANHWSPLEVPDQVADRLRSFITRRMNAT
ncbi:alpha/beta-hydrolase [Corynespora cassiicola Philippines]|uniref:Alpha/beta-hydrolase n=1 Tax=Corynespora cassiicola Philippines TaxID=1448308 RepID=A0A2T2P310_CORCC|nr:alpha/beta-hydrolase [Corynespora cassiicola Philippines]